MVNHSSALAWKIPWTEEPILLFTYVHWFPEETYTFSINGTQEWSCDRLEGNRLCDALIYHTLLYVCLSVYLSIYLIITIMHQQK